MSVRAGNRDGSRTSRRDTRRDRRSHAGRRRVPGHAGKLRACRRNAEGDLRRKRTARAGDRAARREVAQLSITRSTVHFETGDRCESVGCSSDTAIACGTRVEQVVRRSHRPAGITCSSASIMISTASRPVISSLILDLQPIDLIFLIGDEAGGIEGEQQINDLTELEARIDFAFRVRRKADDPKGFDASGQITIKFMKTSMDSRLTCETFLSCFRCCRSLRKLVTSSRPLGAGDYMLPSEEKADPNTADNPKLWELAALKQSFDTAASSLEDRLTDLDGIIATFPPDAFERRSRRTSAVSITTRCVQH